MRGVVCHSISTGSLSSLTYRTPVEMNSHDVNDGHASPLVDTSMDTPDATEPLDTHSRSSSKAHDDDDHEARTSGDDEGDEDDGDEDDGVDEDEEESIDWLATGRSRRSTQGNRYATLLAQETAREIDQEDELEQLFAEQEGLEDEEFTDPDEHSDVDLVDDSSDTDEEDRGPTAVGDELEGEQQLKKEERAAKKAEKRKLDKISSKVPTARKRVKIDESASVAQLEERKQKKWDRASRTRKAGPIRTSSRTLSVQNKERTIAILQENEVKRARQIASMQAARRRKDEGRKQPLTQAERLEEAARIERANSKSLNKWEEMERDRVEKQKQRLEALHNREIEGPFIRWRSAKAEWWDDKLKRIGNVEVVETEEAPRKRGPKTIMSGVSSTPDLSKQSSVSVETMPSRIAEPVANTSSDKDTNVLTIASREATVSDASVMEVTVDDGPLPEPQHKDGIDTLMEEIEEVASKDVGKDEAVDTVSGQNPSDAVRKMTEDLEMRPSDQSAMPKTQEQTTQDALTLTPSDKPDASKDSVERTLSAPKESTTPTNTSEPLVSDLDPQDHHEQQNASNSTTQADVPISTKEPIVPRSPSRSHQDEQDRDQDQDQDQDQEEEQLEPQPRPQTEHQPDTEDVDVDADADAGADADRRTPITKPTSPTKPPTQIHHSAYQTFTLLNFNTSSISHPSIQRHLLISHPPPKAIPSGTRTRLTASQRASLLPTKPIQPICGITGQPARYLDPTTGIAYRDAAAFKRIRKIINGEFVWSEILGAWVGQKSDMSFLNLKGSVEDREKDIGSGGVTVPSPATATASNTVVGAKSES